MAANTVTMREMIVLITLTPLWKSDVLWDVDEASCFNKRGRVLAFIKLVYSEKINNLRRRS
jgi:hypothetical protein